MSLNLSRTELHVEKRRLHAQRFDFVGASKPLQRTPLPLVTTELWMASFELADGEACFVQLRATAFP